MKLPHGVTLSLLASTLLGGGAAAMDTLTFRLRPFPGAAAAEVTRTGRVVIEDSGGNRYFESDGGERHLVAAGDVVRVESDQRPFAPIDAETLGVRLLADLPAGAYRVHTTSHYAVAYSTSREYAEWVSSLCEGLHRTLVRYWKKQGLQLEEPAFPLPVVVYRSQNEYNAACRAEGVGEGAVGYYNLRTNVIRMYDLTGSEAVRSQGGAAQRGSRAEVSRVLASPAAEPLVATIVHEATHQVCFNAGVMQRMADVPLWLVEGMAAYFEAPRGGVSRGWRGIGQVNARRLATFREHRGEWNASTLRSLVAADDRLTDPRTAGVAYADAWAMNYFLIHKRPKQYVAYVKEIAEKSPFEAPPADASETEAARRRLDAFTKHFGPIDRLQLDLLEAMARLD